jgi:hypothetical protein
MMLLPIISELAGARAGAPKTWPIVSVQFELTARSEGMKQAPSSDMRKVQFDASEKLGEDTIIIPGGTRRTEDSLARQNYCKDSRAPVTAWMGWETAHQ